MRVVIHALNERGFDALDPKPSEDAARRSVSSSAPGSPAIARTSPADWGLTGFSTWSLTKLRDHLLTEGIVAAISRENAAADPARQRGVVANDHDVEGLHRSGFHPEDAPGALGVARSGRTYRAPTAPQPSSAD